MTKTQDKFNRNVPKCQHNQCVNATNNKSKNGKSHKYGVVMIDHWRHFQKQGCVHSYMVLSYRNVKLVLWWLIMLKQNI